LSPPFVVARRHASSSSIKTLSLLYSHPTPLLHPLLTCQHACPNCCTSQSPSPGRRRPGLLSDRVHDCVTRAHAGPCRRRTSTPLSL
uniref:Ovule protein n=1 Tax=Schistocephalus solidus TaxID=70667 RepID=A0A183TS36_SCHSO